MKRIFFLSALMCALSFGAFAQDAEQKDEAPVRNNDVMSIKLGNELARHGYETKSTISLLEAARILDQVPTQAFNPEKVETSSQAAAPAEVVGFNPETLLADAKKFAGNDKTLLALVEEVEKEIAQNHSTNRGRTGGAASEVDYVAGNSYKIYYVRFNGGYTAEVGLVGGSQSDLDLYIYDENNNLIVKDDDYTSECYVRWTPRWTGVFKIKVVNRGSQGNTYVIATN